MRTKLRAVLMLVAALAIAPRVSAQTTQFVAPAKTTAAWTSATSNNTAATVTVTNLSKVLVTLSATSTMSGGGLNFEFDDGSATWFAQRCKRVGGASITGQQDSAFTLSVTNQVWACDVGGMSSFRVRLNPAITGTGTATVAILPTAEASDPWVAATLTGADGKNTTDTTSDADRVLVVDATGTPIVSTTLATHDGALGTPTSVTGGMMLCRASSTAPSNVSASDDAALVWCTLNGALVTNLAVGGTVVSLGQQTAANSIPVILPSATVTTLTPPAAITNFANETGGNLAAMKADLDLLLTLSDFDGKTGSLTETAPASDTASSGLNGRLQRIAQRLSTLITATGSPFQAGASIGNSSFPVADGGDVTLGSKADAKNAATDATAVTIMQILKEISFMEQTPASRAVTAVSGGFASGSIAGGAMVDIGAKADAANAATDTTPVSLISLAKEISALLQAPVSQAQKPSSASGDALTECVVVSAASTNATNCKASAGNLYEYEFTNTTTTAYYVRLYNLATAPTCTSATGFIRSIAVPPAAAAGGVGGIVSRGDLGVAYSTGIAYCLTGGAAGTDNTNAAIGILGVIRVK